jgi:hypothetical protein
MRKLYLVVVFMYLSLVNTFAQSRTDSTRELTLEEVNLVSGYYSQDGNNSAVTGGIGTELVHDYSGINEVKLVRYELFRRKHQLTLDCGVDVYTSASSDKIDPNTISSASYSDTRTYPSINWSVTDPKGRTTWGLTGSFSTEYDYTSIGAGVNFSRLSSNGNREFSGKVNAFFDQWQVIVPIELWAPGEEKSMPRNSLSMPLSLTQVINQKMQMALLLEPGYQQGLLGTSYQRVYFSDGSAAHEILPDTRWKLAGGVRWHIFATNFLVLRTFYRYYTDEWDISAHTAMLEPVIKTGPTFAFMPLYRFYSQQGTPYFAAYGLHAHGDNYFTSDYDLSTFTSHAYGAGIRWAPLEGVFGLAMWNNIELRYEQYARSTGLQSGMLTLGVRVVPQLVLLRSR